MTPRRRILLLQLPIPPVGPEPVRQNVPLAAGYLTMLARLHGLDEHYEIDIFPPQEANTLGDLGLVEAILARRPWMVGFTCYLWNIDRTLWIAERIKARKPEIKIVLGGPEITADNAWVLRSDAVDYAAIGEGEQTFIELLKALLQDDEPRRTIDGLFVAKAMRTRAIDGTLAVPFRRPLPNLNSISSPYLAGILDAADEEVLLLETIRGCVFKCKFCYYPKSYDALYFVDEEKIIANLRHARERGAKEVVLLDPTLNQRRDFADFVRLLARENPERQFTYFGELRAEGITPEIARLLREANFTEVEVGLQSIDPLAMDLMDRKNNLRAFERGVRSMMDAGIDVKIDLIIGLPGDTVESVRRGFDYLHQSQLYSRIQVFNLAVLPGTAFRQEAEQLGLRYQSRTPYYVLQTPTLKLEEMCGLMEEAEDVFETEFDPLPPPVLIKKPNNGLTIQDSVFADLDARKSLPLLDGRRECPPPLQLSVPGDRHAVPLDGRHGLAPPERRAQAYTLSLRSADFDANSQTAAQAMRRLLDDNPHTTLQVILDPAGEPSRLTARTFEAVYTEFYRSTSYLDRFYSLAPGSPPKGAKRLVVTLPGNQYEKTPLEWFDEAEQYASVVANGGGCSGFNSRVDERGAATRASAIVEF
jgi:radical SAM superfamily enzyme YgiQ (UPF0313 family)